MNFNTIGYPLMVGLSRKSFIGKTLNLDVDERDVATVIMETVSVTKISENNSYSQCKILQANG